MLHRGGDGQNVTEPATSLQMTSLRRNRDYLLLFGGQVISVLGGQVQSLALPLLILAISHSPAQAGIVYGLGSIAYPIVSLPAGALVDRWDRKTIMIVSDLVRALLAASIPLALWVGDLTMVQVYLVATASGVLATFFTLAETASLPSVVAPDQLPATTAQNMAALSSSSLVGPLIGGFLYGIGQAIPFVANGLSYVISAVSLRALRVPLQARRPAASSRLRREIAEGFAWMWRHPVIRFMAFMNGIDNLVLVGGNALVLIILARAQHAPPDGIGLMFSIGAVGSVAGSLAAGHLAARFTLGQVTVAMVWLQAILFPLYTLAPNPVVLGALDAVLSFVLPLFITLQFSYRLAIIPNHLLGRVTSSIRLFTVAGLSLGPVLTGALVQAIGPKPAILALSVPLVLLALATTLYAPMRTAAMSAWSS